MKTTLLNGVLHKLPDDMKKMLSKSAEIAGRWNNLTPIQRNEWICWVTIVKKEDTRKQHIVRMKEELEAGKRTPCCWPGCPHRRPKAGKWFR
ncbi:MAG: YdeI/OmpD-associated family protein [Bacteroidia bacterium]|nr:YdeI/OmpD-associated family protein [Bacteroidia bacterium]